MEITTQEAAMLQAFREAGFPPLYVLIRLRNDVINDNGTIPASQKEQLIRILETCIAPLWQSNQETKQTPGANNPA